MMANGILHLFLYRIIYYYFLLSPSDVEDLSSLLLFLITTYLLIVRLAGIFHFSAGVLCLFGFNLPRPFEHYFFAHSFSDIWRRINIYWRDFITKVFYYPIYFRLRSLGSVKAMIAAVLITFAINWFLHGWQWFWIRGSFPLTPQDILFWAIFGVAVALNTYRQIQTKPAPAPTAFNLKYALKRSIQIGGMFSIMTILWSFWTTPTIPDWLFVMEHAGTYTRSAWAWIALTGSALMLGSILVQFLAYQKMPSYLGLRAREDFQLLIVVLLLSSSAVVAIPKVHSKLSASTGIDLSPVLTSKLNAFDKEQQHKGYYETLLEGNNFNSLLSDVQKEMPEDWNNFGNIGAAIWRNDLRLKEIVPNQRIPFKGALFTSNGLGIRDKEYPRKKAPNTLRIALLGGSIEMGTGVNTSETYENLLEDELNRLNVLGPETKIEILNFSVSGNHLFQNVAMLDKKARPLNPDIIIYTAHSNEQHRAVSSFYKPYITGRDLIYSELKDFIHQFQLPKGVTEQEFFRILGPEQVNLVQLGYRMIIDQCNQDSILPVWIFVPTLDELIVDGEEEKLTEILDKLGVTVLSVSKAFDGSEHHSLQIAKWDTHPNKQGHRILADAIQKEILKRPELLQTWKDRLR